MVSKKLQSKSMCIDATIKRLESMLSYFEKNRKVDLAKSVALEMNVEPIFLTKHLVIRKWKYFEENDKEHENLYVWCILKGPC